MIPLPPPPKQQASPIEWEKWYETIWRYVRPSVQFVADTAASVGSGSTLVVVTSLSAPRTLTLPATSLLRDGDEILFIDGSGAAGTHTITIARAGSDTINGGASVTITANYGRRSLRKAGEGKFFSA